MKNKILTLYDIVPAYNQEKHELEGNYTIEKKGIRHQKQNIFIECDTSSEDKILEYVLEKYNLGGQFWKF